MTALVAVCEDRKSDGEILGQIFFNSKGIFRGNHHATSRGWRNSSQGEQP